MAKKRTLNELRQVKEYSNQTTTGGFYGYTTNADVKYNCAPDAPEKGEEWEAIMIKLNTMEGKLDYLIDMVSAPTTSK